MMKEQLSTQKYTIAWFRLAEFVLNGKKQHALSIFRLLAYSLPDEAIASQLEGDLLWSFEDEKALDAYYKSAQLYEKQEKYMQAIALYELLLSLQPYTIEFAVKLFKLTQQNLYRAKEEKALAVLMEACEKHQTVDELIAVCNEGKITYAQKMMLYERIVLFSLQSNLEVPSYISFYLEQIVDFHIATDEKKLRVLLANVRALNESFYHTTSIYLKGGMKELAL